jgi:general secretion pathway protein K
MKTKSHFPNPFSILRNSQSGVALLMAVMTLSLLLFIAIDVQYDATVDYVVAQQQVNRIKAYYAAKSGIELSLLRIMLYKQAVAAMGNAMGAGNLSMLDPIWQFPFMWPPTAIATADTKMTEVDKDMIKSSVTDSLMEAQYTTQITPEGGHIDINDLGSDIKGFKKLMKDQVLKIFTSELEQNEAFRKKYAGYRFEELVNNISDYIDEDSDGQNGSDEASPYRDIDDKDTKMPPNRPLRTLDELHMVAGMNEDFYNLLASRVTVFGTKGVNVNYASPEILKALDPSMTDTAVSKAVERRGNPKLGGPFKDDKDFFGFLQGYGVNTKAMEEAKMPLLYDMEFNFRIVSDGLAANVKREITVVTYDYPNLTQRLIELLDKQEQQDQGQNGQSQAQQQQAQQQQQPQNQNQQQNQQQQKQKIQSAKGRPTVVYWEEN